MCARENHKNNQSASKCSFFPFVLSHAAPNPETTPKTKDIFNKKEDKQNCKGHQIPSNLLIKQNKSNNKEEEREQS